MLTYISEAAIGLCDLRRQRPLVKGFSFSPATWRLPATQEPHGGRRQQRIISNREKTMKARLCIELSSKLGVGELQARRNH